MSDIKRLCPFCNTPLFPVVPNQLYVCAKHGFHVDYVNRVGYFGEKTPEYCKQSFEFLRIFFTERPLLAMNPNELFSEDFKSVDTVYLGGGDICSHHKILPKHVESHKLIAGNGQVGFKLLRSIVVLTDLKCEVSPLALTYELAEQYLFNLSALASCDCSGKVSLGLGAYLMPTLEAMASVLTNLPKHDNMPKLTNESILYSNIFMQPQINMKWDTSKLRDIVESFVHILTTSLPESTQIPFDYKKYCIDFPRIMYSTGDIKDLYFLALKGNVATAANEGKASFDVMQFDHYTAKGAGNRMTSNDLLAYRNLHGTLEALFLKYAKPYTPYGLEEKKKCLKWNDPQSTSNEVVLSYWKTINEKLKKES